MDLEHQVVERMMLTNHLHRRVVECRLSGTHVHRAQHKLLMMISKGTYSSQVEIANHQQVSPATVAVSLKKLEKDGYINRNANHADNRINDLQITEKGQKVVEQSKDVFQQIEKSIVKGFSEDEMKILISYLERMYQNLNEEWRKKEK